MSNTKKELLKQKHIHDDSSIDCPACVAWIKSDPRIEKGKEIFQYWLSNKLTEKERELVDLYLYDEELKAIQSKDQEWKEKMEAAIKHEKDHGIRLKTYPIPPITK